MIGIELYVNGLRTTGDSVSVKGVRNSSMQLHVKFAVFFFLLSPSGDSFFSWRLCFELCINNPAPLFCKKRNNKKKAEHFDMTGLNRTSCKIMKKLQHSYIFKLYLTRAFHRSDHYRCFVILFRCTRCWQGYCFC